MRILKSKHVRKTIQHDLGVDIIEHSYVKESQENPEHEPTKTLPLDIPTSVDPSESKAVT